MNSQGLLPAYQKIKEFILAEIAAGDLKEGSRVPSENELARHFEVARMTANRAVKELVFEGHLIRIKGDGTFVKGPKHDTTLVEIRPISEEILSRGESHAAVVLRLAEVSPSTALQREFNLQTCDAVFFSQIVHQADGVPIQLEERWVNPGLAPHYLEQDFSSITPTEYLTRVAPLEKVQYRVEATHASLEVAKALAIDPGDAVLVLHRRTFSAQRVATVVNLHHPGTRFALVGHI